MKKVFPLPWVFPLTILGIGAVSVRYLNLVFNGWIAGLLVSALTIFLLSRAKLFLTLRTAIATPMAAWIAWTALTVLWSDAPGLSAMKAVALAVTVVSLASGGVYWAQYAKPGDPLIFLAPLTGLALAAGLFGLGVYRHVSAGVPLFEGLANNVNLFAIMITTSLPYPLHAAWRAAKARTWIWAIGWSTVVLALLAFLVLTRARASIAAAICVLAAFALAALPRKALLVGAGCIVIVGGAVALSPLSSAIVGRATHYVAKGHDENPYFTRQDVWRISYEHAVSGGMIGLGLGANSQVDGRPDTGDSLASGYTREKGSSPLAIVEETGLIGLAISAWLLACLFWTLISRTTALPDRDARVAAMLAVGLLAGLVAQSVFEAWWTAPGSFGSMVFWATAGVALGIQRRWRPGALPSAALSGPRTLTGLALAVSE